MEKGNVISLKKWQKEREKRRNLPDVSGDRQVYDPTPGDFLAKLARLSNDDREAFNRVQRFVTDANYRTIKCMENSKEA